MVETKPQCVEVEIGGHAGAGRKGARRPVETVVEIFDPRGPVRRERELGAGAGRPADVLAKELILGKD